MASNRFVLAALVGGVVVFLVGGLLYGILTVSFFEANQGSAVGVMKETPDFLYLVLGQVVLGVLLAVVIDKWARVGGVANGLQIGAIVGLLMGLGIDLTMYGVTNISNLTATLVDPLIQTVQMACAGGAIGAVLGNRT